MKAALDPVGPGNDRAIVGAGREAALVVCAWGNHAERGERAAHVVAMLQRENITLHALRLNAGGQPAHPLYLSKELRPKRWRP